MRSVCTGILALCMTAGVASAAAAQSPIDTQMFRTVRFSPNAGRVLDSRPALFAATPAPRRQSSATSWAAVVLGGVTNASGAGFAVGGGVQASNFLGRDKFGLQIDGLFSNAGGCDFCDQFDDGFDFDAHQIAISAAFLYKFKESSGSWRPYVGGGLVFSRFSYSFDDNFVCDVIVDCSSSATGVGIQAQGGVMKGGLLLEARAQGSVGGAFLLLAGYRFGGD